MFISITLDNSHTHKHIYICRGLVKQDIIPVGYQSFSWKIIKLMRFQAFPTENEMNRRPAEIFNSCERSALETTRLMS